MPNRRGRRVVAVRRVALAAAKREPTATSQAPEHQRRAAAELVDRVLAVGVDAAAERVAVLGRVGVPGGDPGGKAAVLAEREDLGAVLARHVAVPSVEPSSTTRTSTSGSSAAELVEHRREVLLLVPGRDEDERVGHAVMVEGTP